MPEVLEGLNGHDPVDGVAEISPPVRRHPMRAVCADRVQQLFGSGVLVVEQGQADDVDVVLLDGPPHGGAPAAADVEQCHAGLEVQFVQVQVDLGDLGFLEREIRRLEVGAAIGPGRVLEQREEVVGDVVVGLDISERVRVLVWAVGFGILVLVSW